MNTYKKYCPNVFVAQCEEKQEKGSVIIVETKYGKQNEHIVHNFVGYTGTKENPLYCYSITRVDGLNNQERAKNKIKKLNGYADNADKRSQDYYEKSNRHRDFLSLAEPIKIGHHSERRHRKIIDDSWNNMGKSIAESDKAEEYRRRAEYWESMSNKIDLSMPESLEYFEYKLQQAKETHRDLKENPEKRSHSMSLQYANKSVKDTEKNLQLAVKLWGSDEEIEQLNKEVEKKQRKKAKSKNKSVDELIEKYGGFWFFGSDRDKFKEKYNELLTNGYVEKGEKVCHIVAGLYVPVKHKSIFINEL